MSTIDGNTSGNGESPKGSIDNPYTEAEFNNMCNAGTWTGGYVEGLDYVFGNTDVTASWSGSNFGSDIWDSFPWDDPAPWDDDPDSLDDLDSPDENQYSSNDNNTDNSNQNTSNEDEGNTQNAEASQNSGGSSGGATISENAGLCYTLNDDGTYTWVKNNNIGYHTICVNGQTLPINSTLKSDATHGIQFLATLGVFFILADSTDIEWAASFNEGGEAYINTTNKHSTVDIPYMPNYRCVVHSHPEGTDLDNVDKATYAGMLERSCLTQGYCYQKFYLYRNGALEDVTREIWQFAEDYMTRYPQYKHLNPYK